MYHLSNSGSPVNDVSIDPTAASAAVPMTTLQSTAAIVTPAGINATADWQKVLTALTPAAFAHNFQSLIVFILLYKINNCRNDTACYSCCQCP